MEYAHAGRHENEHDLLLYILCRDSTSIILLLLFHYFFK
jgi:hypothetical protein